MKCNIYYFFGFNIIKHDLFYVLSAYKTINTKLKQLLDYVFVIVV